MGKECDNLRELVEKEIGEIGKRGELDDMSLEHAYKLVDILKDLGEIEEQDGGYSERYSGYPYMMESGRSNRSGRYSRDGYSMRQNRDSMGRYSREYGNSYGNSYRGYSRDGEDIMGKLERMMDTGTEAERQTIQRIMNQM